MARLDSDGCLDPTFNGTGKVITQITLPDGIEFEGTGMALQPDGKILMAGIPIRALTLIITSRCYA